MANDALFQRLKTWAQVTTLASTRVYPVRLPQTPRMPCVVFTQVSDVPESGMLKDHPERQARYQVTAWARKYQDAWDLRLACTNAVQRWMDTERTSGVTVLDSYIENEFEDWDDEVDAYELSFDLMMWYDAVPLLKWTAEFPVVADATFSRASVATYNDRNAA